MVVVDASALAELLLGGRRSAGVVQAVAGAEMVAPDLINAEVLSAVRRLERLGEVPEWRAAEVVDDLRDAPVTRLPTLPLLAAVWALRENISAHDAFYVAAARMLEAPLVTADRRLARSPGLPITVISV